MLWFYRRIARLAEKKMMHYAQDSYRKAPPQKKYKKKTNEKVGMDEIVKRHLSKENSHYVDFTEEPNDN